MIACNKAGFETQGEAKAMAKRGALRASVKPLRPYRCPACGFWHLSSMSKKMAKQIRKRGPDAAPYSQ
jgi:hypothetical protein